HPRRGRPPPGSPRAHGDPGRGRSRPGGGPPVAPRAAQGAGAGCRAAGDGRGHPTGLTGHSGARRHGPKCSLHLRGSDPRGRRPAAGQEGRGVGAGREGRRPPGCRDPSRSRAPVAGQPVTNQACGGVVAVSLTLGIVKPDAVATAKTGKIVAHLQDAGFTLRAARLVRLTPEQAGAFYAVHRERPFFADLVSFMTSGPCLPMALERADAVPTLRTVIGATDPAEAAPGTIRKLFAESKGRNAIHASDSDENAAREVGFFFPEGELAALWG